MKAKVSEERPSINVEVFEAGARARARKGWYRCEIGTNLEFSTDRAESYFFAQWEPVYFDTLLVAAAVEFCDRVRARPASGWRRDIELKLPVHEPDRWNAQEVNRSLTDALEFLTGDAWQITFRGRKESEPAPRQGNFALTSDVTTVIPFSDGLDSLAVAGIKSRELGSKLVRVRLSSRSIASERAGRRREPFTLVPFSVREGDHTFHESSMRSRGFKFAILSGLAAYLAKADQVIVPESGQGALGPTLVPVGQAHVDYRSHPLFTSRMEKFLDALLHYRIHYVFPQIWSTKGETLRKFVDECKDACSSDWVSTRSCWQQSRQVSVDHRKRQCGICAACMLRRQSVHAAGLVEPQDAYVWEDLSASEFESGAAALFRRSRITPALRDYAVAGILHLDHMAAIRHSPASASTLAVRASRLGQVCDIPEAEAQQRLVRMLQQHETEWKNFVSSLGPNSFVRRWAASSR